MEWLTSPEIWIAFFTLTALEIVLGIDNIIMISILVGRMPKHLQPRTRFFGLALAMVTRILLLLSITWVMRLTADLFHLFGQGISGRDLILFFGGLFLLWKSSSEIYQGLEGEEESGDEPKGSAGGFIGTIIQIAIIDIVFSLDSVITAVGMVSHVPVMVAAIIVAVLVMMLCAGAISDFIDKHPSLKMLALSFLIVVGTVLIAEAFEVHVPKGYVYFAMAFSLAVEALNIRMRGAAARKRGEEPVKLRKEVLGDCAAQAGSTRSPRNTRRAAPRLIRPWARRRSARSASAALLAWSARRRAISRIARRLLACWLRWLCTLTLMPLARWVARTAESVVLTCWPPGPEERRVSKRISPSRLAGGAAKRSAPMNQFLRACLAR